MAEPGAGTGSATLVDRTVFMTSTVEVGIFRCPRDYPRFRDAGPIRRHIVVFPRTSVWIRHAGRKPFVADPTVATLYNAGQDYERFALAPDGDRSDWYAVSPDTALAIAREANPAAGDQPQRPFAVPFVRTTPQLYARQRALFRTLLAGAVDVLEAEETVLEIVATAIGAPLPHAGRNGNARKAEEAHRDLAQRTKAELARDPTRRASVADLAGRLGTSPFHLCRVFKAQTGLGMHAYRLDVRLRHAIERLEGRPSDCSALAYEMGFSSHSHFTSVFRRWLGLTPSEARHRLARNAALPAWLRDPRHQRSERV